MFGLAEAANRYDRNRAEGFRGYAEARIRGAIIDEIRTHTPLPRDLFEKSTQVRKCIRDLNHALGRLPYDDEVAAKLEIPLEKYHKLKSSFSQVTVLSPALVDMAVSNAQGYFNEHPDNPQDQYFLAELQEQLANFIKKLSPREQRVLSMYYRDELLLKEIGEKMGVTESRISQILSETVQRLREMIEASDG
jgi:RNA polymerase sigma factor for flagellar operon FliA